MANLPRKAKSGNTWIETDLMAYNIRVEYHDAETFFQSPALPAPVLEHPAILQCSESRLDITDRDVYKFIRAMDLAMMPLIQGIVLLDELGYSGVGRALRTCKDIWFLNCGENRNATTDVCIVDDNNEILLLVQDSEDRLPEHPRPQLVAKAIAAFQSNNLLRRQGGLSPHIFKVIPGIVMNGTSPGFSKIPVTPELVSGVISGIYPATETIVEAHLPAIPRPSRRSQEGMRPLDNRLAMLSCYEAFKQFVG
ncbi:hypothetical protein C8R45DRAFT_1066676 [Mycena sanguinolenta]|nr:hypothetical protein C8R45DRAFT_1066676 [Mycena sanguinolenta]